jgi:hypothetical protein
MRADVDGRNTNLNVQAKNAHDASCMQVIALDILRHAGHPVEPQGQLEACEPS